VRRKGIILGGNMKKNVEKHLEALGVDSLETGVEELIAMVEQLQKENHELKAKQSMLLAERAELVDRNDVARSRVESIITRLKDMEEKA
jgi:cell division protein ZapB